MSENFLNWQDIRQFDKVTATLAPRHTEDLTSEARRIIGKRFTLTADYRIDEGFAYAGEWHMTLTEEDWKRTGVFWIPSGDLVQIELAISSN